MCKFLLQHSIAALLCLLFGLDTTVHRRYAIFSSYYDKMTDRSNLRDQTILIYGFRGSNMARKVWGPKWLHPYWQEHQISTHVTEDPDNSGTGPWVQQLPKQHLQLRTSAQAHVVVGVFHIQTMMGHKSKYMNYRTRQIDELDVVKLHVDKTDFKNTLVKYFCIEMANKYIIMWLVCFKSCLKKKTLWGWGDGSEGKSSSSWVKMSTWIQVPSTHIKSQT